MSYYIIGFIIYIIISIVGFWFPLALYLVYRGRAFVNDSKPYGLEEKALSVIKDPFAHPYSDCFIYRFFTYVLLSFSAIALWPGFIVVLGVYLLLLVLRLSTRVKKHTEDKDAHK